MFASRTYFSLSVIEHADRHLDHNLWHQLDHRPENLLLPGVAWGDRWVQPAEGQPMRFVHRNCGHAFAANVTCSSCGEAVRAEDVSALPGPGGAEMPGTMVLARRLGRRPAA